MERREIASLDNANIKQLRKLNQIKYREESGTFFVENFVIIKDALKAGYRPKTIFATSQFEKKHSADLENILQLSGLDSWFEIDEKINKSFSNLETPSGIAAVYAKPAENPVNTSETIIYLNSVGDPGNLGAILRSALAFGFKNVVVDETCADLYNFKTINSAKDAIFKLNFSNDRELKALKKIKQAMPIIATRMANAKDLRGFKKPKKFCLVLGDESRGVSEQILKLADQYLKINISPEIESLNVASAGAIIFYQFSNV